MKGFKDRDGDIGFHKFNLNVEELATVWHFPSFMVKAPLIKRTVYKKASPPTTLPTMADIEAPEEEKPTFDYDNEYFEEKFSKDKEFYDLVKDERQERSKKVIKAKPKLKKTTKPDLDIKPDLESEKEKAFLTKITKETNKEKTDKKPEAPPNLPIGN